MPSVLRKVGCTIVSGFLHVCHRLAKNNNRVIVKFTTRKDWKQVPQVREVLKDLNADDLNLPRGTKIFVNQSLRPYYCLLWSKIKHLQSVGKINSFFVSGVFIKIKIDENSKSLATHILMI